MQTQSSTHLSSAFLQKFCTNTSSSIDLQAIDYLNVKPETINAVIDFELKQIRDKYVLEEESFIQEELTKNPVICERRASPRSSSDSSSSACDVLRQQRAESCRKSRINNKIKKAKSKFRHKFITIKMLQNASGLECIREVIAHTESKLRNYGCTEATLNKLRESMGIDLADRVDLSTIFSEFSNN